MADDFEILAGDAEADLGGFDPPGEAPEEQHEETQAAPEEGTKAEESATEEPWAALIQEGETPEQALLRVEESRRQNEGRAAAHWREIKEMKESLQRLTKENDAAQRILEMLNAAQEETEKQAAAAAEPDPDLDPEAWQRYQFQKQQEKLDRMEQLILEKQKSEDEKAKASEQISQVNEIDNRNFQEINQLLAVEGGEANPEFSEDWELVSTLTIEGLKQDYPTATMEQILELFNGILVLSGRNAAEQGTSLAGFIKDRADSFRRVTGVQRKATTNGKPGNKPPTPAEIQAAAEREKKSRGVRRIPGGTGGRSTVSSLSEFASLSEEEQVKLVKEGKATFDSEDLWKQLAADINP